LSYASKIHSYPFVFFILADNNKEKNSIKILCTECKPQQQFDHGQFELHHKKEHLGKTIIYACVVCDYNAKKFILLRNHFRRHLIGYDQKSDVNFHKASVNNHSPTTIALKPPKPAKIADCGKAVQKCPDCGKILQTTGGLFTHRKMHLEKPKFKCTVCEKEFFQKVNLVNHEKTHNIQNRNYRCCQCDKSFFEKSHLLRHQNFHSESRDFQCQVCLKFYKTERCLKVRLIIR
jgi:hypothetical protein